MNLNLTKQQAFDQMVAHMRSQQALSTGHGGFCVYRSPDGLKCAVGALIPDDQYKPEFEGKPAEYLPIEDIELDSAFLVNAQTHLHDRFRNEGFDLSKFEKSAERFAKDNNLTCPTN